MIRYSELQDVEQLKALWKSCFDDGNNYIEAFFDSLWLPDRCLVYTDEGRVVSMLFLLPGVVQCETEVHSIHYVYACGTTPESRSQGLMNQLLDEAYRLAGCCGIDALLLIPAGDKLVGYYGRCGFLPCSTQANYTCHRADLPMPPLVGLKPALLSPELLLQLRSRLLPVNGTVMWPLEHLLIEMNADEAEQSGGAWVTEGSTVSYMVYTTRDEVLHLKEFATNAGSRWQQHLAALVQNLTFDRLTMISHPALLDGELGLNRAMIRTTGSRPLNYPLNRLFLNLGLAE